MNKNGDYKIKSKIGHAIFWICFLSIFLFSSQSQDYFRMASNSVSRFLQAKGNFQTLRLEDPINFAIKKAKSVIPQDKAVKLSPQKWTSTRCTARYALYPLKLDKKKNWDFFIDLDKSIKNLPANWKQFRIFRNVSIYAKPDAEFLQENKNRPIKKYPSLFIFLTFLYVTMFHVLIGLGILSILKISYKSAGIIWYLSTAHLTGFVCLSLAVWIYLLVGGTFELIQITVLFGFLLGLISFFSRFRFINDLKEALNIKNLLPKATTAFLDKLFFILMATFILMIVSSTVFSPVWSWDAMSHWVMKAKVIFHQKTLAFDYTHHNEYPILWPLNIAIHFIFANGTYDELAKWSSALLFCSFISQLISGLITLKVKHRRIWILISIFLICFVTWSMTTAYAENAFCAFLAATLVAIIAYFQHEKDNKYLIVSIIMAIGLSTVKLEGAVASGIIALVFISLGSPPFLNKKYWLNALYISSTSLIAFLWISRQNHVGYSSGSIHLVEKVTLVKIQAILCALPKSLMNVYGLKVFGFLGIFILLLSSRLLSKKADLEKFLLRTSLLLILFTIAAFSKWNPSEIYRQSATISRIFLHALPPIVLYLGYQLREKTQSS